MGAAYSSYSSSSNCISLTTHGSTTNSKVTAFSNKLSSNLILFNPTTKFFKTHIQKPSNFTIAQPHLTLSCKFGRAEEMEMQKERDFVKPVFDPRSIEPELLQKMSYDALVWCSLHGLVVGDRNSEVFDLIFFFNILNLCFKVLHLVIPFNYFASNLLSPNLFNLSSIMFLFLLSEFLTRTLPFRLHDLKQIVPF